MAKARALKQPPLVVVDEDPVAVPIPGTVDGVLPPADDVSSRAVQLVQAATTMAIVDQPTYEAGVDHWKRMKRTQVWWKNLHAKPIQKAKESLAAAREAFSTINDPLELALDSLKERLEGYLEGAKKRQREGLAAASEHRVAQAAADQHAKVTQQFEAAVDRGDHAKAARILDTVPLGPAIPPPPPPTVPTIPKVDGVVPTEPWTYDIVNEADIPREYMMPNRKMIAQVVKAMQAKTNIPGIQARPETSLRISAKE